MPQKKSSKPKTRYQKFMAQLRRNQRDGKGRPLVLSEGDSWFAFPKELRPSTIDVVDKELDLVLMRLEANGDEVSAMLTGKQRQRLKWYLKRWPFDILLFSGGGNDVVGDKLYPLINTVSNSAPWEEAINKEAMDAAFTLIEFHYRELIDIRNTLRPNCQIITHCYDYPIPREDGSIQCLNQGLIGPWIWPALNEKGLTDPQKQRKFAKWLLQQHRKVLKKIEAQHPNFHLVDTAGTLADDEWGDEIHPTKNGFKKVAGLIGEEVIKHFPTAK
ncbi:hypothetical protein [Rubellicoccus peritrichatus]|uniref:SGNH hydrolase-type esterase domain-containing protein n=1 Tax=Rubellicoccus peritrichatus TaxID=3080537 RepID=A0AAQ3L756_9BACT|nr:hypothetical protein [Puniceicoccus sp. CR14]WOO40266.1 hypothetical protein RZN69_16730 [Puniceicoccus sp. CR14]